MWPLSWEPRFVRLFVPQKKMIFQFNVCLINHWGIFSSKLIILKGEQFRQTATYHRLSLAFLLIKAMHSHALPLTTSIFFVDDFFIVAVRIRYLHEQLFTLHFIIVKYSRERVSELRNDPFDYQNYIGLRVSSLKWVKMVCVLVFVYNRTL